MRDYDIGFLPVLERGRLVGIVTDRDIVTRGVAEGLSGNATVRKVMTTSIVYSFETDSIEEIICRMAQSQVRRIPILDATLNLTGIVTLSDLATKLNPAAFGSLLRAICDPPNYEAAPADTATCGT
jgi:CBS domain-containing protein